MEAAEAGADYVAFGAFFNDRDQGRLHPRRGRGAVEGWHADHRNVPSVAIGGITVETARALARAGADFLAVSAGVWRHPDGPAAAVRALEHEMAAGVAERS